MNTQIKQITNILKTKYPLIQAPMNWLTDAKLVAAVSENGGLGILGPNAGQKTPALDPDQAEDRLRNQIHQVRQLTSHPFGINVSSELHPGRYTKATLRAAYAEHVHYFAVVGEPQADLYADIKAHDGIIIARPLTPTIANAIAAESYGADILVATGYDEGGVLPQHHQGTFTVVPMITDAVTIPVMAAGGINDQRGVRAAFALGASGVYIGSRFLLTKESPMAEATKQAIINGSYSQVALVSDSQRSLLTVAGQKYATQYTQHGHGDQIDHAISQQGGLLPAMRLGNIDDGIITVNTGIDTLNEVTAVHNLIPQLMEDIPDNHSSQND